MYAELKCILLHSRPLHHTAYNCIQVHFCESDAHPDAECCICFTLHTHCIQLHTTAYDCIQQTHCTLHHAAYSCIQVHFFVHCIHPHSGRQMQHGCTCMQHAPYAAHRMQRAPYATRCIHPNFNAFRSETHTPAFTQTNATWMHMYADHRMQLYAPPTCMQLYVVRPSVCGDMQHIVCGRMQSYACMQFGNAYIHDTKCMCMHVCCTRMHF